MRDPEGKTGPGYCTYRNEPQRREERGSMARPKKADEETKRHRLEIRATDAEINDIDYIAAFLKTSRAGAISDAVDSRAEEIYQAERNRSIYGQNVPADLYFTDRKHRDFYRNNTAGLLESMLPQHCAMVYLMGAVKAIRENPATFYDFEEEEINRENLREFLKDPTAGSIIRLAILLNTGAPIIPEETPAEERETLRRSYDLLKIFEDLRPEQVKTAADALRIRYERRRRDQ